MSSSNAPRGVRLTKPQRQHRIAEIDRTFAQAGYFEGAPAEEVRSLREERERLQAALERLFAEWERVGHELLAI